MPGIWPPAVSCKRPHHPLERLHLISLIHSAAIESLLSWIFSGQREPEPPHLRARVRELRPQSLQPARPKIHYESVKYNRTTSNINTLGLQSFHFSNSSACCPSQRNMSFAGVPDVDETDAPMSAASPSSSSSVSEDGQSQAPAFKIPSRTIAAVEHPFLIQNLDKGLDTFGPNPQFQSVSSHQPFPPSLSPHAQAC